MQGPWWRYPRVNPDGMCLILALFNIRTYRIITKVPAMQDNKSVRVRLAMITAKGRRAGGVFVATMDSATIFATIPKRPVTE